MEIQKIVIVIVYVIGMGISHPLFYKISKIYREGNSDIDKGAVQMAFLMFYPVVWIFLIPEMITQRLLKIGKNGTKNTTAGRRFRD
jgi:hypothetical protein